MGSFVITRDGEVIMFSLCVFFLFVITRDSEVIMFPPCVCVCLFVYHYVCPGESTMKDWYHTNNILQEYRWRSLVVQVMFYRLMTSSMTSSGEKVGQTLKLTSVFIVQCENKYCQNPWFAHDRSSREARKKNTNDFTVCIWNPALLK